MICLAASLLLPALSVAQDSTPSRFEAGGGVTAIRGNSVPGQIGPTMEGDMNFGRHIAMDAAFNWLPQNFSQTVSGFFGAKAGIRRDHFGLFGKVRPGFFSTSDVFRSSTLDLNTFAVTTHSGRLTERALDLGGVAEYYPSRHWLLRWDMGDTLLFAERTQFNFIGTNPPPSIVSNGRTTNNFTFSTSVHYRF
jgi:hypothetical protein